VRPGSRSTMWQALLSLNEKRFAEFDIGSREWRITSIGRCVAADRMVPTSALALGRVTQSLLNEIEKHPDELNDLLSRMFVYFAASSGKLPISQASLLKQTKATLALFSKGYTKAIRGIWIDAVERMIGHFSSLLAAILLYRSSSLQQDKAVASDTIEKIAEQWFRSLSREIASFLSMYLADLDNLAALETRMNRHH
jgi:hypothetical protein